MNPNSLVSVATNLLKGRTIYIARLDNNSDNIDSFQCGQLASD